MRERLKAGIRAIAMEREFLFNSGMIFSASLLGAVFMFAANILLSRHFGPEVFGNFKTVVNLFLFLPALIELGAGATLTRYIAEFSAKEPGKIVPLVRWFLKLRLVSYLSLGFLVFIFREQIAVYFLKDVTLNYLILPGILISLFMFFEIFKPISLGFQNFRAYSAAQFLTFASQGILITFLGYLFGVYYAIVGWAVSYLIGNLIGMRLAIKKNIFQKSAVKLNIQTIFLTYSTPMHLMVIPMMLGTAAIPILSLVFPQKLIGYYAFAWTFYTGVLLIPTALYSVLFPKISGLNGEKDVEKAKSLLKKVFAVYTPIVILGIASCLLFSESIVRTIAPAYIPGLNIFKTLISLGLILGYFSIYKGYLSGFDKIRELAILVLIQNLILLIVSWIVLGRI